jgi:dTDP-4-dehydrorhamnose reductase
MNRLVVVGSGGRLGAALVRAYRSEWETVGFDHAALDLSDTDNVRQSLDALSFDVLVNCAALTNVDYCETHETEAMQVNAHAVRTMAETCTRKNARMLHISTDYVFDGTSNQPYREEDVARPLSVYGQSKLQGEQAVLTTSDKHLVVRVSWVFGPDRPSFVDTILERARHSECVKAIVDKYSAPTFSLDAARYLRPLLESSVNGVLHVCNSGGCSWREYGQFAIDCAAEAGIELKTRFVDALQLSDMRGFVAQRPVYTVMSTQKVTAILGEEPRDWRGAVSDYVRNYIAPQFHKR